MLICSEDAPKREDYCYAPTSWGGYIGWPKDARPHINRGHIDGPLLYMRNGELHWLTLRERVSLWIGRTDAFALERKYRPELSEKTN